MTKLLPFLLLLSLYGIQARAQRIISLQSPDKRIGVRVSVGADVSYSVYFIGNEIVHPSRIGLTIGGKVLGKDCRIRKVSRDSVNGFVTPVYGKMARIAEHYQEVSIDLGPAYTLIFRAYNEGVAWRWVTRFPQDVVVDEEAVNVRVPDAYGAVLSVTPKLTTWELPYTTYDSVGKVPDEEHILTPALFRNGNRISVVVAESDLLDYPGMFLQRRSNGFYGYWARYPKKETPYGGEWGMSTRVEERESFIARTKGKRSFPWRAIIITDDDRKLLTNQLLYLLAGPSKIGHPSWIRPGKCDWEWWHDAIVGDAGIPTGMEHRGTALYKHYIDFAASNKLEYTLIDAGWSNFYHPDTPQRVDIEELVRYGKAKNVGILVWCNATSLMGRLDHNMETFAKWGLKGIKVDFFDRDDQKIIQQQEQIAAAAAKWHLVVDLHGSPKPAGLQRTYPNVINFEAVRGEECSKWDTTSNPDYHLQIPFIRMLAGAMDYTPGSMRNRTRKNFVPVPKGLPMTMGTRAHELALFILLDQYLAVLSDSPEEYRRYKDILKFLREVPVTFDDTKALQAKLSEYAVLAKKKGAAWYVGAITNWQARDVTVDLGFLEAGKWTAEIIRDGVKAAVDAQDYITEKKTVDQYTKLPLHLAPGGGAVIKISKASI